MKDNVFIMDHPLIQHKLSILRDEKTGSKQFRELVSEIAMLMCYESTRDLPLTEVEKETMAIGDNVTIGDCAGYGACWEDFSHTYSMGDIRLTQGWNVVEVKVLDTKDIDFNFKSVILNLR